MSICFYQEGGRGERISESTRLIIQSWAVKVSNQFQGNREQSYFWREIKAGRLITISFTIIAKNLHNKKQLTTSSHVIPRGTWGLFWSMLQNCMGTKNAMGCLSSCSTIYFYDILVAQAGGKMRYHVTASVLHANNWKSRPCNPSLKRNSTRKVFQLKVSSCNWTELHLPPGVCPYHTLEVFDIAK